VRERDGDGDYKWQRGKMIKTVLGNNVTIEMSTSAKIKRINVAKCKVKDQVALVGDI
jgi:hypothetical protein